MIHLSVFGHTHVPVKSDVRSPSIDNPETLKRLKASLVYRHSSGHPATADAASSVSSAASRGSYRDRKRRKSAEEWQKEGEEEDEDEKDEKDEKDEDEEEEEEEEAASREKVSVKA